MFSKYYQSELAYLREVGRAFGEANPSIAGLLTERGGDPDVERLLEGFCFLTARIRERIDAGVPEVVHGLAELLVPQYLRPVPAASIIEFTPHARALRARARIAAGAEVAATPVEGTSCLFRTTAPLELLPVSLTGVTLDQSVALAPRLKIALQTTEQGLPEILRPEGIRLFIHGELSLSSTVLLWLLRYCRSVGLHDVASGRTLKLPPSSIRGFGFQQEGALLPWPARANEGFRLLQEYFTLPQKFMFVDVRGLEAGLGTLGEKFELVFEFDRPPPLPSPVGKDLFRLHCVPVVNLFAVGADPIVARLRGEEHLLRATGIDPQHMEVYSVDSVMGLKTGRAQRTPYQPFVDFSHALGDDAAGSFFRIRRAKSILDDGLDTFLSVGAPDDVAPEFTDETLSIDLTCTNRSLPARLGLGDVCVATPASPTLARFRNIVAVSKPVRPPLGSELHWRLLSHLALNQRSMADLRSLRGILELYNFQMGVDHPAARANQLRVEAVEGVHVAPVRRLLAGLPVRGLRTTVELEEGRFAGAGDAFLFGAVLDELFAANVTVNAFNELVVRLQPSQMEHTWPPRNGAQQIV